MTAPANPGLLTPLEAAPLLGYSRRHVATLIAQGWFPENCIVRMGRGKRKAHIRLVLQRLIEARLVLPPVVALLCLVFSLPASEHFAVDQPSRFYDLSVSHHGKHALGGVAIGAVAYTGAAFATDEREDRYAAAVISGVAVGVGYELVEGRDGKSYADPVDALWVAAGALVGAAIADATDQLLTITPKRDGAALTLAWRF